MSKQQFFNLEVKDVIHETPDTVSLAFHIPDNLSTTFAYASGQYVTLKVNVNGKEQRRSYSMSSFPDESGFIITIKKVAGGQVSPFLHKKVKKGDKIDVSPPEGRFLFQPNHLQQKDYFLFAAGSGITPIYSILKSILELEPKSTVYLFFGNRTKESIIFHQALQKLSTTYAGQLHIVFTLSQQQKAGSFKRLFKKSQPDWHGWHGRIDADSIAKFMELYPGGNREKEFYLCGPFQMIEDVFETLEKQGVKKTNIHREYFTVDTAEPVITASGEAQLIVHIDGEKHTLSIDKKGLILEQLIKKDLDPPYSCASGTCSTCTAKVTSGEVKMDACYALDDDEIKEGYILTCQSRAISSSLEISYDDV